MPATERNYHREALALILASDVECSIDKEYKNNSGVIGGASHREFSHGVITLNPLEAYLFTYLRNRLICEPDTKTLNAIEIGGMLSASFTIFGNLLQEEVKKRHLKLFSTNFEDNISREKLLLEARRRLPFIPLHNELLRLKDEQPENYKLYNELLKRINPLVFSPAEIEFYAANQDWVTEVRGMDILDLPAAFAPVMNQGGADLIVDIYAGLTWSSDIPRASITALRCLSPKGVLFTNHQIDRQILNLFPDIRETIFRHGPAKTEFKYYTYATGQSPISNQPFREYEIAFDLKTRKPFSVQIPD
jgi:hypothetical protein